MTDILILGGGYGGLTAARKLERALRAHQTARITLVSDVNFMLFTPLLPGAAAGTLEPRHVVVPLREELRETDVRLGSVLGSDPARSELTYTTSAGDERTIGYDHLVVSVGSVSRVLPVPGLAEHGVGFKTTSEAVALRNHAISCLEAAEVIEDAEGRRAYLTFVFVGAGYAGVEGIAELQDYVGDLLHRYPRCHLTGTRWILVEASDTVMPEIPPSLGEFAAGERRARGVEIMTGTRLEGTDGRSVTLSTGERIPARTVCWTTGVKPSPSQGCSASPRRRRAHRDRPLPQRRGLRARVGDRRRRRGSRPGEGLRDSMPADGPARDAAGQGRAVQHRGADPRRRPEAVSLPHPRGVRGPRRHKAVAR